jgi:hypothetical protein
VTFGSRWNGAVPFQILGMEQLHSIFGKKNRVIFYFIAWFKSESRTSVRE